jgi:hypothetical protein
MVNRKTETKSASVQREYDDLREYFMQFQLSCFRR